MHSETATQAIYDRIRKRESEQSILLALCQKIAPIQSWTALEALQADLRTFLGHDLLLLFVADRREKKYFRKLSPQISSGGRMEESWDCRDRFFQDCVHAAEPVQYRANEILNAAHGIPEILREGIHSGSKVISSIAFRIHDQRWAILSLGYKKPGSIDFQLEYRLKGLIPQLGITIGNILMNEQLAAALPSNDNTFAAVSPASALPYTSKDSPPAPAIIGEAETIVTMKSQLATIADTMITVLIQGESGTGKEAVAQTLHQLSRRSKFPLIKINCAAIAPSLIESELFGHEKGSFSGAIKRKIGKFEQANGGTLFLDEIGDLPLILQAKLLRVLQEKEIERIGGNSIIPIDVRMICATHKDLQLAMQTGTFRADLYYRISAFPLTLPPLRERQEDIPLLAEHFLKKYAGKDAPKQIGKKILERFHLYSWPGNIRELEHLIARAILLTQGPTITKIMLPNDNRFFVDSKVSDFSLQTLANFEKQYIIWVLKRCKGRISGENGAATILGIPPTTLQSKMKKLGITKKHIHSIA